MPINSCHSFLATYDFAYGSTLLLKSEDSWVLNFVSVMDHVCKWQVSNSFKTLALSLQFVFESGKVQTPPGFPYQSLSINESPVWGCPPWCLFITSTKNASTVHPSEMCPPDWEVQVLVCNWLRIWSPCGPMKPFASSRNCLRNWKEQQFGTVHGSDLTVCDFWY